MMSLQPSIVTLAEQICSVRKDMCVCVCVCVCVKCVLCVKERGILVGGQNEKGTQENLQNSFEFSCSLALITASTQL